MRNLNSAMKAGLGGASVAPVVLVLLTFRTGVRFVWSGVGSLVYAGNTYVGVGSLGTISAVQEGTDVRADGISVALSGIDPALLAECMTDIRQGAPAKVWFGLWSNGAIVGTPYLIFSGQVDKPTIQPGADEVSISLACESRMANGQRARNRRYTAADQQLEYPNDTGFNWVEEMNDIALLWG